MPDSSEQVNNSWWPRFFSGQNDQRDELLSQKITNAILNLKKCGLEDDCSDDKLKGMLALFFALARKEKKLCERDQFWHNMAALSTQALALSSTGVAAFQPVFGFSPTAVQAVAVSSGLGISATQYLDRFQDKTTDNKAAFIETNAALMTIAQHIKPEKRNAAKSYLLNFAGLHDRNPSIDGQTLDTGGVTPAPSNPSS